MHKKIALLLAIGVIGYGLVMFGLAHVPSVTMIDGGQVSDASGTAASAASEPPLPNSTPQVLDKTSYDTKLLSISNLTTIKHTKVIKGTSSTATSTIVTTST